MLRRVALTALAAALLACPARVPKNLRRGAYVRLGVLGNPIVQVGRVEHGVLVCHVVPTMAQRRIPLSQIKDVHPVSAALVARIKSLAHQRPEGDVVRRVDDLNAAMAHHAQQMLRAHRGALQVPVAPVTPEPMGNPALGPGGPSGIPPGGPSGIPPGAAPPLPSGGGGP